ncbi:uncharacterized protein LOC106636954 [Copidosoma floridanum]|uniref:uncharacterized protein LOC106636954 n=1 Tax=Copidosoma floridanum TaxID=29053 RepID=UPI0006C95342|nr:uncharacterized protein LOC106636954 [Copidosoma floridanum]
MADAAAARREARKRRILENSENRMHKIFGVCKNELNDERLESVKHPLQLKLDNGFVSDGNDSVTKHITTQKEKTERVSQKESNPVKEECRLPETKLKYSEPDNHIAFRERIEQNSIRNNADSDNSNFDTTATFDAQHQALCKQSQRSLLVILFFSPLFCLLLAVLVNVLIIANVDFSSYKGILTPYIIFAITRLCLEKKFEESQGSSMLVAALVLCNIDPAIVHSFKKVLSVCSAISRDFALYLTSFVLFNWIISISSTSTTIVQFL